MIKITKIGLVTSPDPCRSIVPLAPRWKATQHVCRVASCPKSEANYSTLNANVSLQIPPCATADQPTQGAPVTCITSRRYAVLALVAGVVTVQHPKLALAFEEKKLPKEYRQLVKRLSEGLSESIEAEASGASEAEVRRKADPAKDVVREFVRKWRDNPLVSADITHAELKEALSELGEFYMSNGQRSKLTVPVRESVLKHLSAAKESLTPEPEKKGSGLLGLF